MPTLRRIWVSRAIVVGWVAAVSSWATAADFIFATRFENCATGDCGWALEETFDGDPASPSQALLPDNFDFVVTHRTHPRDHTPLFDLYPADHGDDCAGPAPPSPAQHMVATTHLSNGANPDPSFYICKNHMMSSMGDVEGYSVTAFWARQAFDFSDGGIIEFDVNINDGHARSWWEILITTPDQLKVGAAQDWLPIDETYPRDRILLEFSPSSSRLIMVGSARVAPDGWDTTASDWRHWADIDPSDPALTDRRIRRRMRVRIDNETIVWEIEKRDGTFDGYTATLNAPLPFRRGLVLFKTHAYTPTKDENYDRYTYHWDNIRFSGPRVGEYAAWESSDLVYLQANGNRDLGEHALATIQLDEIPAHPRLFGQLHGALTGQVLLSINGGEFREVHPYDYAADECGTGGWSSFGLPLSASELRLGQNEFRWQIGPRPTCAADWVWNGFSVKSLEIQAPLP